MDKDTMELTAQLAHELNRQYCILKGDYSQPKWGDAPEWIKESTFYCVVTIVENPDTTPEDMHNDWLDYKLEQGWTYGVIKDSDNKIHPYMVEYNELSELQKFKGHLFIVAVRTVLHAT